MQTNYTGRFLFFKLSRSSFSFTPVRFGQPRLTEVAAQPLDYLLALTERRVKDAEGTAACGREVLDSVGRQCYSPALLPTQKKWLTLFFPALQLQIPFLPYCLFCSVDFSNVVIARIINAINSKHVSITVLIFSIISSLLQYVTSSSSKFIFITIGTNPSPFEHIHLFEN